MREIQGGERSTYAQEAWMWQFCFSHLCLLTRAFVPACNEKKVRVRIGWEEDVRAYVKEILFLHACSREKERLRDWKKKRWNGRDKEREKYDEGKRQRCVEDLMTEISITRGWEGSEKVRGKENMRVRRGRESPPPPYAHLHERGREGREWRSTYREKRGKSSGEEREGTKERVRWRGEDVKNMKQENEVSSSPLHAHTLWGEKERKSSSSPLHLHGCMQERREREERKEISSSPPLHAHVQEMRGDEGARGDRREISSSSPLHEEEQGCEKREREREREREWESVCLCLSSIFFSSFFYSILFLFIIYLFYLYK